MTHKTIAAMAAVALALGQWTAPAVAQQTDVFSLNYFDHAYGWDQASADPSGSNFQDASVRITNPGTQGAPTLADPTNGDLCAMIYVFRPDQQLAECCGCPVTPNGLVTLSVNRHLTSNPLTDDPFPSGVVKILSSTGTVETGRSGHSYLRCNAAAPTPTPTLLAWGTHIQGSGALTETAFTPAALSADELDSMVGRCGDILGNGSGHGVCECPSEGHP
ncbi:MAG: hypothetical protein KIT14_09660 [bacterium]|nr:hypothetical protein [bacterium]